MEFDLLALQLVPYGKYTLNLIPADANASNVLANVHELDDRLVVQLFDLDGCDAASYSKWTATFKYSLPKNVDVVFCRVNGLAVTHRKGEITLKHTRTGRMIYRGDSTYNNIPAMLDRIIDLYNEPYDVDDAEYVRILQTFQRKAKDTV